VANITVQVTSPGLSAWGVNYWGDLAWSNQTGTTTSVGQLNAYNNEGWGRDYWGQLSWGVAFENASWGRGEWGEFAWGDNYSTQVTGQSLSTGIGSVSIVTDVAVTAASQQLLTLTQGQESIQIDADIFVFVGEPGLSSTQGTTTETGTASVSVTGQSLTTGVGQAVGGTIQEIPVTGISASLTLGTISLVQSTNEPVTGQAMTLSLGTPAEISATNSRGYRTTINKRNWLCN
jgi:hypothetical protein